MMPGLSKQSRRRFLRSSVGGAMAMGIGSAIPSCFAKAAASSEKGSNERVLVVIQLTGGNDGLNTVVPYADEAYYAARPKLSIAEADALKIDDELGLHPSLRGMQDLLQDGQLTIIQGVGYDQPNRSHFESMDIWHTCRRKNEVRADGWLGRYLDDQVRKAGGDVPAMHLGSRQQPYALASQNVRIPTVRQLDEFQLRGGNRAALRTLLNESLPASQTDPNDLLQFVQSSTSNALAASERVAEAAQDYQMGGAYPESDLATKLQIVAQLIDSGLTTRVYYLELDGFDTHSEQRETHAILLRQWSDAVSAFVGDLADHGHSERVCVMTFSEFGRRVAENASQGTDHGAAAPMFLCGGDIKPGIVGKHPDLTDLQDGDLKHDIDFRSVYASVLEQWLGSESESIIGSKHEPLPLFA